jgi:hypothetical protein
MQHAYPLCIVDVHVCNMYVIVGTHQLVWQVRINLYGKYAAICERICEEVSLVWLCAFPVSVLTTRTLALQVQTSTWQYACV